MGRVQTFAPEQRADLPTLCTAVCLLQNAQLVLGRKLSSLGTGQNLGICYPAPADDMALSWFNVRHPVSFLRPLLYTNFQNGVVSLMLAQRVYQIRIKGHLGSQWTDWFEGLTITLEDNGDTLLTGPVVDQAALHGLLKKVRDLGMPLVSVSPLEPGQADQSDVK
jgi:hypothetical protein